jgi:hypothetical protein
LELSAAQKRRFALGFYDRATRVLGPGDGQTIDNPIAGLIQRQLDAGTASFAGDGPERHLRFTDAASVTGFRTDFDAAVDQLAFAKHPAAELFGDRPQSAYAQAIAQQPVIFDPESRYLFAFERRHLDATAAQLDAIDREARIDDLALAFIPRNVINQNGGVIKEFREATPGRTPSELTKIVARFPTPAAAQPAREAIANLDQSLEPEKFAKFVAFLETHPDIRQRVLPGVEPFNLAESIPTKFVEYQRLRNTVLDLYNETQAQATEQNVYNPGRATAVDTRTRPSIFEPKSRVPRADENTVEADRARLVRRIEVDQMRNPENWGREIDLAQRLRLVSPETLRRAEDRTRDFANILTSANPVATRKAFVALGSTERLEALTLADPMKRGELLDYIPKTRREGYETALGSLVDGTARAEGGRALNPLLELEQSPRAGESNQQANDSRFTIVDSILTRAPAGTPQRAKAFLTLDEESQRFGYAMLSINERNMVNDILVEAYSSERERQSEISLSAFTDDEILEEDLDEEVRLDRRYLRGIPINLSDEREPAMIVAGALEERFKELPPRSLRQTFTIDEMRGNHHLLLRNDDTKQWSILALDDVRMTCVGVQALAGNNWSPGFLDNLEPDKADKLIKDAIQIGAPITLTPAIEQIAGRDVATGFKLYMANPRTMKDQQKRAEEQRLEIAADHDVHRVFSEFHSTDEQAMLVEAQRIVGAMDNLPHDQGAVALPNDKLLTNDVKLDKDGNSFEEPITYTGTILKTGVIYAAVHHDTGPIYAHKLAALASLGEDLVPGTRLAVTYGKNPNREEANVEMLGFDPRVAAHTAKETQHLSQAALERYSQQFAAAIERIPREPGRDAPVLMDFSHDQRERLTGEVLGANAVLTFIHAKNENAVYPIPTAALGLQLQKGEVAAISAGPEGYNLIDHAMGEEAQAEIERRALLSSIDEVSLSAYDRIEKRELAQALGIEPGRLVPASSYNPELAAVGETLGLTQHRYSSNLNLYVTTDPSKDTVYFHSVPLWNDKGLRSQKSWDIEVSNVATLNVTPRGHVRVEPLLPYEREEYRQSAKWAFDFHYEPKAREAVELQDRADVRRSELSEPLSIPYERHTGPDGKTVVRPVEIEPELIATVASLDSRAIALESISMNDINTSCVTVLGIDELPAEELQNLNIGDLVSLSIKNDGIHINHMMSGAEMQALRAAQSSAALDDSSNLDMGELADDVELTPEHIRDLEARSAVAEREHEAVPPQGGYDADLAAEAEEVQAEQLAERHMRSNAGGMSR